MARVVLVGKGPPARDGIATFLTMLQTGLTGKHDVVLANLTREGVAEGGRFTGPNMARTIRDAIASCHAPRIEVSGERVGQPVELAKRPSLLAGPNEVAVTEPVRGLLEPVMHQRPHRKHSSRF